MKQSDNLLDNAKKFGSSGFRSDYGLQYSCMGGAMAGGISSELLVIKLGKTGCLGSFGSGGLSPERIKQAIINIQQELPDGPYAFNMLHNPGNPDYEMKLVDLYLEYGVTIVEAAAFINLSPALVRYRLAGLSQDKNGSIVINNRIIGKVSRQEVALNFMRPAPELIVDRLLAMGLVTEKQAEYSQQVPVADDITAEADSGGHTDNRPLVCMLPGFLAIRDRVMEEYGYQNKIRIGAAGGISTPNAALGAFYMGADYIVTGSINQACVESGTSDYVKQLLAKTEMADVMMAPAADMFEAGAKVQVVKRGTMFPLHAQKLFDMYKKYPDIENIPPEERNILEKRIFKKRIDQVWHETIDYFNKVDTTIVQTAMQDPRKKMALVFRWYLGQSSHWAIEDLPERRMDAQIWCGQSMGAFNEWVKGTELEKPENRKTATVTLELLSQMTNLQNKIESP